MKSIHLFFAAFVLLLLNPGCQSVDSDPETNAARIHEKVLTIDTHCDTPLMLRREGFDIGQRNDARNGGGRVDFVRMKEGGLDAMFFAVFVGQGARDQEGNERAKQRALDITDAIYEAANRYPGLARIGTNPEDAYANEKEGLRTVYLGLENGYPLGNDLSMLQAFYDRGIRYITLAHTSNNDICDSSTDRNGPEHDGLSSFGEEVVQEMNRLGMIIDVSHISDSAFYDVLRLSNAPVIASHSCARALCDNPRNLSDDMLLDLAENGGVLQMCILSAYLKTPDPNPERDSAFAALRQKFWNYDEMSEEDRQKVREEWYATDQKYPEKLATVKDVVDHIDHVVEVAGIDHIGIGTDFDGGGGVEGCYDVSEMGNITLELVRRGYTEKEIRKIWGGNFMRVFRDVQKSAG
jgi:membrane dipeptidase